MKVEPAEKEAAAPEKQHSAGKQCKDRCPLLLKVLYGASLSACDGYINANTKMRFGTYGGMMTGNTVALGMSFAKEEWENVALFCTIIVLFFIGAMVGWAAGRWKKRGSFRFLALFVGAGFVVLEVVAQAVKTKDDQKWTSIISPFLMGMVDVIGFKGSLGQHITFMTGNVQKLAGTTLDVFALSQTRTDDVSKPNTQRRERTQMSKFKKDLCIVGSIWTFYVVGALAGASMSKAGDEGAWTLCLPAAIITLLMVVNEGPESKAASKKEPPLFRLFKIEGEKGITISGLRSFYEKLGLTLSPEEERRFQDADSNDDGTLNADEFRAWMAA